MRRVARIWRAGAVALMLAAGGLAGPGATPAAAEDAGALARAMAAVASSDWPGAQAEAARSGPLAVDIVDWHRLRAGRGTLAEYIDFAARNGDWPGMALFYERGEETITGATPAATVLTWFGGRTPHGGAGALALLAALPVDARADRARGIWVTGEVPFSPEQEAGFLSAYGPYLTTADHDARAIALLDAGLWEPARRILALTGPEIAPLADVRVRLQSGAEGVDDAIRALPDGLRDDAGLAMDRYRWRVRAGQADGARALMAERSTTPEALRDPAVWAPRRTDYARAALRAGEPRLARQLAENHFLPPGNRYWADLTFLAGYAALKSGDPAAALTQFRALEDNSSSQITQSRALYWQARALQAAGDTTAAEDMMRRAARFQGSYYGQIAAEAVGAAMDPAFANPHPGAGNLPDWRDAPIRADRRFQAAIWLHLAGAPDLAARFLNHMAETATPEDIGRMSRLMTEFGHTHHALRLAKAAASRGVVYPDALFPLPGIGHPGYGVPEELVLAIARQESEFNPRAGSHVGARGLMQVMPATAQDIARQTGMAYDLQVISTDAAVNARFGAYYLRQLRDRFGPSLALVASGYNAGPGRANQWLGSLGEIRGQIDPVDWVEMIPFDETRNYVMRVGEALAIYRARLAGQPVAFTLRADLSGGGTLPPPAGPRQTIPFTLTEAPAPPWKALPPTELPEPFRGPR